MVYLVTYDLVNPERNREALRASLKRCGDSWEYLDSTSILSGDVSEEDILGEARAHIGARDRILIIPVARPFTGALPMEAWRWLEQRL